MAKITRFSVWGLLDKLDNWITVFWDKFTGASEPFLVPPEEVATRPDVRADAFADAFSGSDFESGYLALTENGFRRQITLLEGVTTVEPWKARAYRPCNSEKSRVFRVADSGEDSVEFIREKNRYYVQGRNPEGGVRLNGRKLPSDERTELKPCDAIQFSHTTLTFFLPEYQARK